MEEDRVTIIYLIRHGHTVDGDEKRYKGHIDVELSEEGRRQVRELAEGLRSAEYMPDVIYSSDLIRARESAAIIGREFNLGTLIREGLRERGFGVWEGMSFEEIALGYPDEFKKWKEDPLNFSPPGGESTREVHVRVRRVLRGVLDRHEGETVFLVSHGGVNRVLLAHLMGLPLENIFRIEQDYGCVNKIRFFEDGFSLVMLVNGIFYNKRRNKDRRI